MYSQRPHRVYHGAREGRALESSGHGAYAGEPAQGSGDLRVEVGLVPGNRDSKSRQGVLRESAQSSGDEGHGTKRGGEDFSALLAWFLDAIERVQ